MLKFIQQIIIVIFFFGWDVFILGIYRLVVFMVDQSCVINVFLTEVLVSPAPRVISLVSMKRAISSPLAALDNNLFRKT